VRFLGLFHPAGGRLSTPDAPVLHRLRRILRRFGQVLCRCLQVVFGGDRCGVADPLADDVPRELFGEFRLPSRIYGDVQGI